MVRHAAVNRTFFRQHVGSTHLVSYLSEREDKCIPHKPLPDRSTTGAPDSDSGYRFKSSAGSQLNPSSANGSHTTRGRRNPRSNRGDGARQVRTAARARNCHSLHAFESRTSLHINRFCSSTAEHGIRTPRLAFESSQKLQSKAGPCSSDNRAHGKGEARVESTLGSEGQFGC